MQIDAQDFILDVPFGDQVMGRVQLMGMFHSFALIVNSLIN